MEKHVAKRFNGIMAGERPAVRRAVSGSMCLIVVTMAFGPLAFMPVGDSHALVLVVPVALAALLFGKWRGCAVGALAGLAEMVHSIFQPYDYYEKYFSAPINSIAMFALLGLLMGALFALACRLPRAQGMADGAESSNGMARIGALVAACAAGSVFSSLFLRAGIYATNSMLGMSPPLALAEQLYSTHALIIQIAVGFVLTAVPCVATDILTGRMSTTVRKLSVRTTFNLWFGILTVAFFFMASGVAYTAITYMSQNYMEASLQDHLDSMVAELAERDAIVNAMEQRGALPREELREFSAQAYRNIDCDLPGWSQDTVVLAMDGTVFSSNDPSLVEASFEDLVASGLSSVSYEEALRVDHTVEYYQGPGSQISFVRAEQTNYDRLGGTGTYQFAAIVPSSEVFLNRALYMYLVAAVFLGLLGAIFLLAIRLLDHVVVRSVDSTNEVLKRITAGELDQRVPDSESVELSSLAVGINTTVSALEDSIAEANARIERELAAARTIQESALPPVKAPFPDMNAFDLYATMDPAREVGGDFYDFFELSGGRVGFVVADVSGKGMPAALFMMAAKTAIHGAMEAKANLAQAIKLANRSLCKGNESEMFVTAFAGVIEYGTGRMTYVNAGHSKPLLMRDGEWTWLGERSGPYLGSFDWVDYNQHETQLLPGDMLFVYTDGVSEAFNENEERYGNERLEAFLGSHAKLHPRQLLHSLRSELRGWAVGADQSDDITMLALKFGIPPEHGDTLETTADLDNFAQVEEFVVLNMDACACPPKAVHHVLIAVEELVVNVCSYAYPHAAPDEPGPLRVHYTYRTDPEEVVIEIADDGVPFDPLAHDDPVQPETLEDANVGGLGLVMTKKFMDKVEYLREGITNTTTITKRLD